MVPIPNLPQRSRWVAGLLITPVVLFTGCSKSTDPTGSAPPTGTGTLELRANGEDFVRAGFVSKDGWDIRFDHVYVTLAEVTAYQTEPAFDPQTTEPIAAKSTLAVTPAQTVDLAAGDATAEPIVVATLEDAPTGHYNALAWAMVPAPEGPAAGAVIVLDGTATKAGESIDFVLRWDEALKFECGEFVGDERKGILAPDAIADVEATFHFDHLFGDGDAPAEDAINTGALGFDPLAAIATDNTLDIDTAGLKTQLAAADYALLLSILPSLGHVGEGHCRETQLNL